MALDDRIRAADQRLKDAIIRYARRPTRRLNFRDLWVTTSGNPCPFCRSMEDIAHDTVVFPGDSFPSPDYSKMIYLSGFDINYVEEPGEAHRGCLCVRRSVPM